MKFTLAKTEDRQVKNGRGTKQETVYFYECESGEKIAFHAHPTQSFVWIFVNEGVANMTQKLAMKIVEAFVAAGLSRNGRTFDQAIAVLEV